MTTGTRPERRSSDWKGPLFVGTLAVVFLWFFVTRSQIELKRPVPWPDEGSFLWQALAFRDGLSLFAPELHPGRDVLWMPPGYMVLEGTIFMIVPFSLTAARVLSAMFLCGAFACLAGVVRSFRSALGLPLLFAVFLFSPILLVVGNVARMESLVLLLSMAGFLLLSKHKPVGLAVLALSPLVHPNGLFACVGGLVYFAGTYRSRRPTPRRELLVFAFVALAWAAYAVYVGRHFPAFVEDMRNQLRFKEFISAEDGGAVARVQMPLLIVPVVLLSASVWLSRRLGTKIGALSVLAGVFFVESVLASGWLYEAYVVFALLLATIVVVETALTVVESWTPLPSARLFALASLSVLAAFVGRLAVNTPFASRSLVRTTANHSKLEPTYFTPGDYLAVASVLKGLEHELGAVTVQFIPDGEALLFEKLKSRTLKFAQQTFYPARFNVVIVHESRWSPPIAHGLELMHVLSMHAGTPETTAFRVRDETERFVALRWRSEEAAPATALEEAEISPDPRGASPP
jgi:hypothetical protein